MQSHPDFNPSDAMKWGIVVDSDGWVWCSSSDIGDAVWQRNEHGQCSHTMLSGQNLDPAIVSKRPSNLP